VGVWVLVLPYGDGAVCGWVGRQCWEKGYTRVNSIHIYIHIETLPHTCMHTTGEEKEEVEECTGIADWKL
jgi:hypothetical protein